MEFGNPIVGSEDLIRKAIKSPDFSSDPETGVQGWRIAQDGTATFYNLVIGSPNFTIDENGNAVFNSVTAESIILNGSSLSETLARFPRGIVALSTLSGNSAAFTGTPIKCASIIIPNFDPTRQYAIGGSALRFDRQSVTTIDRINLSAYLKWDAPATTADTLLWEHQEPVPAASGIDQIFHFRHPFKNTSPGGTDAHISFYFFSEDTSPNGLRAQAVDSSRIYVEDTGPAVTYGNYDMTGGTAPPQQYVKTYSAQWSGSYQADGDNRNVSECYQGYYSGTNGNQYSLIGLPYATIQADLAGATIVDTEVYLNNNHWYNASGGTLILGTHTYATEPTTASLANVDVGIDSAETFTYGQAKWFWTNNSIATALKNGTAKGLALGPGPSTSKTYYGYFAGNGQSGEPQIRITYTK